MKRLLLIFTLTLIIAGLHSGMLGLAQGNGPLTMPRYPIDLEGMIQDINGMPVDDVILHIRTEYPTEPFTDKAERKYYRLNVDSSFHVQLTPGSFSMTVVAEKEGYARTAEYRFKAEELSAKDVVIRLLPAVRQSKLDTGLAWPQITKEGNSFGYSFKRGYNIPLAQRPDPLDIYVYLEVTGTPESFKDTANYSMALVGVGVSFCEASLMPTLKYIQEYQRFRKELLQASEDGYVARIEVDDPKDFVNRYFYFKTREGKYGKFNIEGHNIYASDSLLLGLKYYFQPDGTKDLAEEVILSPTDISPPETTDDYKYNGVWTKADVSITLVATDDMSGVAHTYYLLDGVQHEGTVISISEEGKHTVVYWSVDNAGNVEASNTIDVWIDKTSPHTIHDYSYDGVWINTDAHIILASTDGLSGVEKICFTINGGSENMGTAISITTEGNHAVKYWSIDKAGNTESFHEISVKIDKTPPVTTGILTPTPNESGWVNKLPVKMSFTATDNLSGVAITTPSVTIAEEGIREIKYSSRDNAGNIEAEKIIIVKIDVTPPITIDNYAYNGVWVNKDQKIILTPTDKLSGLKAIYYTVDGIQSSGTSIAITAEGIHTVEYWSVDNAGNTETKHGLSVKIDKTPPVVEAGADIKVVMVTPQGTVVTIRPTVTDNFDPSPRVTTDAPPIFPLGTTTVTVTAIDHAGNIGKDTVKVIVYLKLPAGSLQFVPHVININRTHGNFMAFIKKVGMGLTVHNIDGKSVVIRNPFNNIEVKAKWSMAIPRYKWRPYPRESWMIVVFSRKELIDSFQGHTGNIALTLAGNISKGTFEGKDTVKVIKPRWYHHWWYKNLKEDKLIEIEEQEGLSIEDLIIQNRVNKEFK